MSCSTCGHTMHAMGCKVTDSTFYWCPRCGTIKPCDHEATVPALVDSCRKFRKTIGHDHMSQFDSCRADWQRLGIAESIDTPENRPS